MPTRRFLIAAAVVAAATPSVAWAHARLVSSHPGQDAVVASPTSIQLTFSERLVAAFSRFDVVNAAGVDQPVRVRMSDDRLTLSGIPVRRLATGTYTVNWTIASSDGHRMTGSYVFSVR